MVAMLRPRWLVLAALLAIIVGAVGLFLGEARYSPIALLVAELLLIYAAILWATPTIPPLSTLPPNAPRATSERVPAGDPRDEVGAHEQAAGSPPADEEPAL